MTYARFEDTPAWNAAIALAHGVYDLVELPVFNNTGDLRSQLQRAVLSISNNIAEGFERGTTPDLIQFLYIARASAGEVRSALRFASHRSQISNLKSQISNLIAQCEGVSRQLRAWADSLQNSDIPGQKFLNDQTLRDYDQRQRTVEFMERLRQLTPHLHKAQSDQDPQS